MKFSKKDKVFFYLILLILITIIGIWIHKNILMFISLNNESKESFIISISSVILFIFVITFFYTLIFDVMIVAYLDIPKANENFKENFPYIYKFLFNKLTKKSLEIFSIFIIWNYSLYLKDISESMIIAFVLFLPSIFIKKNFQIPIKDIIKTLFLAISIYIFSLFLTEEPKIKISFYNVYLNSNKPWEAILSSIRAIFHFEFYISFLKIIHIVINRLSKKVMKKN